MAAGWGGQRLGQMGGHHAMQANVAAVAATVTGLEWDGNETTNTQRVLRWLTPFTQYPSTYVFKIFPNGPKSGATNPAYWTTFFWGNYGDFAWDAGSAGGYYGAHPYPFDGVSASTGQNWEISVNSNDISETVPNAGAEVPGGWGRWYTQVFRAWKSTATFYNHEFIYDWDLFVSSSGVDGWFEWGFDDFGTTFDTPPPTPSIVIGEAPPNAANTASWGGYAGREQFKGIIRGVQMYDALLGAAASATVANLADVASELTTPGSVRTPWYLNLNPTPSDVTDKSGSGHDPSFPASSPSLWTA